MKTLKIIGYWSKETGPKVFKTKQALNAAKELIYQSGKAIFNMAFVRKLYLEAKILRLKAYTRFSKVVKRKILTFTNELKAMKQGHSIFCQDFICLSWSQRQKLFINQF